MKSMKLTVAPAISAVKIARAVLAANGRNGVNRGRLGATVLTISVDADNYCVWTGRTVVVRSMAKGTVLALLWTVMMKWTSE